MEKTIRKIIKNYKAKTFLVLDLENDLINKLLSIEKYYELGGYNELTNAINVLKNNGEIIEIKQSKILKRKPKIKSKFKKIKRKNNSWLKFIFFKYSDLLDLSYYKKNVKYQTNLELENIQKIYNFIKNRDNRDFVSFEERCLELFDDEKLYKNRNTVLTKLKVNKELGFADIYYALKIRKEIDELVTFKMDGEIKNILILENKASFYSYKRYLEKNKYIGEEKIDSLIFGNGKSIINKGEKIKELLNNKNINLYYLGDIDPEGLGIYFLLSSRNKELKIKLLKSFYIKMLNSDKFLKYKSKQNKNTKYLEYFIDNFSEEYKNKIKYLWENNLRIPQEIIGYEVLD
jgi:hypothetical protein